MNKNIDKKINDNNNVIQKLKNEIEKLNKDLNNKKEDINWLNKEIKNKNDIEKQCKELQKDLLDKQEEIKEFEQELDVLNNKLEEQGEVLIQYKSNYAEEQNKNYDLEKKIKELKRKLGNDNIIETEPNNPKIDLNKAKTYKISARPDINKEDSDKIPLRKKYSFRYKENKEINDSGKISGGGMTMNTTSNTYKYNRENKKTENENIKEELELNPDNYCVIKVIKLPNNNLKWFLFKKNKKKNEKDNEMKTKTYTTRRNRCYSHRKEENIIKDDKNDLDHNDSYSDFLWKPQRNRKDFIDFGTVPLNDSTEKQKKIDELEKIIKDLEEKLNKKEKDLNRLNVNYAKMIKNSKNPENTEEKMVEKLEKLREENKKLVTTVAKLKSEQQFIGLSFIADDLEAEQFIDDNCFEDILDNLVEKEKDKDKENKDMKGKIEKTTIDIPASRHLNTRRYYKSKRKNE